MQSNRLAISGIITVAALLLLSLPAVAQLPLEPDKNSGLSVTAAYEGWFRNPDGTYSLLVGYFNRNHKETLDIPVGPNNNIEPGGPDQGQPTHFLPRRNWGVFAIVVPEDFPGKKLTWTLIAHDQKTEVPMGLYPLWEVEPLKDAAKGNTPPVLRFAPDGKTFQGPPMEISVTLEATVGEPITLTAWATDDGLVDEYRRAQEGATEVKVSWSKFRGPGEISFSEKEPKVDDTADGKAVTEATFSEPGEYILRLQANDISGNGGGGSQCCWTNAHVMVNVKPGAVSQ